MKTILRLLGVLLPSVFVGLETGCRKAEAHRYKVGFYNGTSSHITETRADWMTAGATGLSDGGNENPAACKVELLPPQPIPRVATVSWRDAGGVAHRREVAVEPLVADPSHFDGTIYFKIMEDGEVRVVPLTEDQMVKLSMQQRSYP